MHRFSFAVVGSACLAGWLAVGCGPAGSGNQSQDDDQTPAPDAGSSEDLDGDGYSRADGDCNDSVAGVNPGAADDTCDSVDNDCNGIIDDAFNLDGDPFSTCAGDCDDGDATVFPGAPEQANGVDNDCDGIADNNRDDYDDDGDGYTEQDGDCDDDQPLVNPGAVEVNERLDEMTGMMVPEGVDNDCDGAIDEGVPTCDSGLSPATVGDYARAMELCSWVSAASFSAGTDGRARNIVPRFGNGYSPHAGQSMVALSTGVAVDPSMPGWVLPVTGTAFTNSAPHPDPQPDPADGCGQADPATVNDYIELTYTIEVPSNANSLIYDFAFLSGEFPNFVCTSYDDTFLAILESSQFSGNISFDDAGRPVTINIGFFDVCTPNPLDPDTANCTGNAELTGSGFELYGGTGWLTTLAPVTPGETITLRFILFDEGDRIYDSLVLLDNFRWDAEAVDGPITIDREQLPALRAASTGTARGW